MHPKVAKTHLLMAEVRGPSLERIQAAPNVIPELSLYLPQIRNRSEYRGYLHEPAYGVRLGAVLLSRRIRSAASLRELAGLQPDQKLVLLLFGGDPKLERLWADRTRLLPQIAQAGYDLVVAPSYSAWLDRPRPEMMFNTKRSLVVFEALQRAGATVIPRVAWLTRHDLIRIASWLSNNPAVDWVALDWMTYKAELPTEQITWLAELDERLDRRLRFLINGPTDGDRCARIFDAVDPRRTCITNATFSKPPSIEVRELGPVTSEVRGSEFRRRSRATRLTIEAAAAAAETKWAPVRAPRRRMA
jgi:hypothetical protein